MSAPDHWQSLSREKRLEMEKHARGLVRGSIIEDAASRFMAMCMAEAIGESKRRAALCDPTQDERVKALEAENARLRSAADVAATIANGALDPTAREATLRRDLSRVRDYLRAALRDLEQGEGAKG